MPPTSKMLASYLLGLTFVAQASNVKANRLTDGSINVQSDYLPALKEHPEKAKDWKLMKVELMYDDALFGRELRTQHFAARLTTDQTVRTDGLDNPMLYDLRAPGHKEEERLTGFPAKSPWPAANRIASMRGPFPEKRDDGTTKDITLERLTDCVNLQGLEGVFGKCLLFTLRVIRFVLGECKCGACGNPKTEKIEKLQKLSVASQARVDGDKAGLSNLLNQIVSLKKQATASKKFFFILDGISRPKELFDNIQEARRCKRAAKAVLEQLCSLAGIKWSDVEEFDDDD